MTTLQKHRKAIIELLKVTKTLSEAVLEQNKKISAIEKQLKELGVCGSNPKE